MLNLTFFSYQSSCLSFLVWVNYSTYYNLQAVNVSDITSVIYLMKYFFTWKSALAKPFIMPQWQKWSPFLFIKFSLSCFMFLMEICMTFLVYSLLVVRKLLDRIYFLLFISLAVLCFFYFGIVFVFFLDRKK